MTLSHSPNIVRDGLVLYLDAANTKSLPSENLLQYSEQFNISPWGNSNCVLSSNSISGPYGGTAYFAVTTTTAPTLFYQSISTSVVGTGKLVSSIYAKANTSTQFTLNSYYTGDTEINSTFTLTGSGSTNDPTNSYIESVGEGWYRCTIITPARVNAGTAFNWRIWPQARSGATGIGCYFWGAQLRRPYAPTNYIKTESVAIDNGPMVSDLSGNGNNGTIYGGVSYDSSGSLYFDGVTGTYINATTSSIAGLTEYSASFWINIDPSMSGVDVRPFWHGNYGVLVYKSTANILYFYLRTDVASSINTLFTPYFGQWVNVAVTYGQSVMKLYVNGELASSTSKSLGIINDNPTLFRLGGSSGSYATKCNISNASVYYRELLYTEIKQNFNALRGRYGI
jgi:hypothetical protein